MKKFLTMMLMLTFGVSFMSCSSSSNSNKPNNSPAARSMRQGSSGSDKVQPVNAPAPPAPTFTSGKEYEFVFSLNEQDIWLDSGRISLCLGSKTDFAEFVKISEVYYCEVDGKQTSSYADMTSLGLEVKIEDDKLKVKKDKTEVNINEQGSFKVERNGAIRKLSD